jgi:hypothetical protein
MRAATRDPSARGVVPASSQDRTALCAQNVPDHCGRRSAWQGIRAREESPSAPRSSIPDERAPVTTMPTPANRIAYAHMGQGSTLVSSVHPVKSNEPIRAHAARIASISGWAVTSPRAFTLSTPSATTSVFRSSNAPTGVSRVERARRASSMQRRITCSCSRSPASVMVCL